jgi:hypothetical protein
MRRSWRRGWRFRPNGRSVSCVPTDRAAHERFALRSAIAQNGKRTVSCALRGGCTSLPMNDPSGRSTQERCGHRSARLSRSAFPITETELNVMAALAIIGLSSKPTNG